MAGEYQRPEGEFPCHGARARIFARFEREFEEWLETPEGRFAVWHAREHRVAQAAGPRRDDGTSPRGRQ